MEMKYQPAIEELSTLLPYEIFGTSSEDEDDDDESWRDEYVSEDDIARENGFWIDDDGHWQPLDDDDYGW